MNANLCMRYILLSGLFFLASSLNAQQRQSPLPSAKQLAWHKLEFYLFMHFGPNTFTDKEWGEGNESESLFNPAQLDCRQWCRIAKQSGAKGIIITAKHHDGFCLWPSAYSSHTVKQSPWKKGRGDVLKELSAACKEYGLRFGVYLSPWDRNHPLYGTDAYNDVFVNMMKEIFSNYGPVWELWWDGANGEGPNGKKQVYDWKRFESTVQRYSPGTVVFSDIGPDIRWCGNENGTMGETVWNFLDTTGFARGHGAPPTDTLQTGNYWGVNWIPAECDVSIRPGWFYHKEEDGNVKTPQQLFQLYLKSVGRGANLLLNVPADRRGLIHESDSAALMGFKQLRDENFGTDVLQTVSSAGWKLSVGGKPKKFLGRGETLRLRDINTDSLQLKFNAPVDLNTVVLRENLGFGQRVRKFSITLKNKEGEEKIVNGTSIGLKRILVFPTTKAVSVTVRIVAADGAPSLFPLQLYRLNEALLNE